MGKVANYANLSNIIITFHGGKEVHGYGAQWSGERREPGLKELGNVRML